MRLDARRLCEVGASNGPVVAQAWRYPVKSLGGEQVAVCWADERGLAGDRVWAVQDRDGKLGSGKNSRRFRRRPWAAERRNTDLLSPPGEPAFADRQDTRETASRRPPPVRAALL